MKGFKPRALQKHHVRYVLPDLPAFWAAVCTGDIFVADAAASLLLRRTSDKARCAGSGSAHAKRLLTEITVYVGTPRPLGDNGQLIAPLSALGTVALLCSRSPLPLPPTASVPCPLTPQILLSPWWASGSKRTIDETLQSSKQHCRLEPF